MAIEGRSDHTVSSEAILAAPGDHAAVLAILPDLYRL